MAVTRIQLRGIKKKCIVIRACEYNNKTSGSDIAQCHHFPLPYRRQKLRKH